MLPVAALVVAILPALCSSATPLIRRDAPLVSLPIAKKMNTTGLAQLLLHDQARAKGLVAQATKRGLHPLPRAEEDSAINAVVEYTATVSKF